MAGFPRLTPEAGHDLDLLPVTRAGWLRLHVEDRLAPDLPGEQRGHRMWRVLPRTPPTPARVARRQPAV